MMMQWFDTIAEYDMNIIHCPGVENVLPDALSRLYPPKDNKEGDIFMVEVEIDPKQVAKEIFDIRVPDTKQEKQQILQLEHQAGHFGTTIMLRNLWKDKRVYWKGIQNDVEEIIKNCDLCQRYNIVRQGFHPM